MRSTLIFTAVSALALAACQRAEAPVEAQPTAAAIASAPPGDALSAASFTAWGKDWRAVIDKNVMTLEGPGMPTDNVMVTTVETPTGPAFDGGAKGSLKLERKTCTDAEGKRNDYTATLLIGAKLVRGCAVAGVIPHAES